MCVKASALSARSARRNSKGTERTFLDLAAGLYGHALLVLRARAVDGSPGDTVLARKRRKPTRGAGCDRRAVGRIGGRTVLAVQGVRFHWLVLGSEARLHRGNGAQEESR